MTKEHYINENKKVVYILKLSEEELDILKTCLISAFNEYKQLEYTTEDLQKLSKGLTMKRLDNMINILFDIPF